MITEKMAEFIVNTDFEQIEPQVIDIAKNAVLDFLGVTLAGSLENSSKLIAEYTKEEDSKPEAGVIGSGFKASASIAALANGTMAHSLDYDDACQSWPGHPAAVILPAVLALGEKYRKPGKEILEAYLIGMEVGSKIGLAVGNHVRRIGWHTTGTIGSIAAASAAAKLTRLDLQQVRTALGISASLAAGLAQNFGTMTKPLHAGNGARNGVAAALLAGKGFSASQSIIEEKQGFCNVLSGAAEYELEVEQLGKPWDILATGITFKPYPSCRGTHCAIDAALTLRKEHHFNAVDIASVECIIGPMQSQILLYPRPQTGLQGKFSLEYCAAIALLEGKVQLEHFTNEYISRPQVQELLSKITRTIPSGLDEATLQHPQTVIVRLRDGEEYSHQVNYEMSKGSPENPMPLDELYSKYRECARLVLSPEQTEQAFSLISSLESLHDISELMKIVT
ncbi:MmgE/PrpD family protein [Thermodesulfobacteriota bacterium]